MENHKNVYLELEEFIKKEKSNKGKFEILKKEVEQIHNALKKGEDINQLSKDVVAKHPELHHVTTIEPDFIIIIIVIILLLYSRDAN